MDSHQGRTGTARIQQVETGIPDVVQSFIVDGAASWLSARRWRSSCGSRVVEICVRTDLNIG